MNSNVRVLVTGVGGCIGAWAAKKLTEKGISVIGFDLDEKLARPRMILQPDEASRITWVQGDIAEQFCIRNVVQAYGVTHIIHLSALQIPFCDRDRFQGVRVNTLGTTCVFDAAHTLKGQVKNIVQASSVAALGTTDLYDVFPVPDNARQAPRKVYGATKVFAEHLAACYAEWDVPSVTIRPNVVYGLLRDQGMTADITKAMLATTVDKKFTIRFAGSVGLQYVEDAAEILIALALKEHRGAEVFNMGGDVVAVQDFVLMLRELTTTDVVAFGGKELPFPADIDGSRLMQYLGGNAPHTTPEEAVRKTCAYFKQFKDQIDLGQLDK